MGHGHSHTTATGQQLNSVVVGVFLCTPWQVGVFDLMGESNGALGARLRQMCTAAETKDLFVPSGCPNLGVFETASVHLGEQKQVWG